MSEGDIAGGGFQPYDYRKDSFRTWVQKVDKELLMLHIDMQRLAQILNSRKGGTGGVSSGPSDNKEDYTPIGDRLPFESQSGDSLTGELPFASEAGQNYLRNSDEEKEGGFTTDDLVTATYSIHEATHAMRGYLMLLDQMGLSKDQKKMVRDLEYGMMMVSKLTMAMNIL